ncbi:MAG: hypothetical protein AABZ30_04205 [Myxococcota bacterium]|jgi:hypothetical protein
MLPLPPANPALTQLVAAAVAGREPAGPSIRRRPVEIALRGRPGSVVKGPLCVADQGAASPRPWTGREPPVDVMRRAIDG